MCLFTKQICPIKARKDIVCYKLFSLQGCVLITPFQRVPAYLGETMTARQIDENFGIQCGNSSATYRQRIYGGFIHAFIDKPEKSNKICVKCIIPKGTLYYKSIKHNGYPQEICAKTIILKEFA